MELGAELAGRRLEVSFATVAFEPTTEGACAAGFDPALLERPAMTEFRRGDTIGMWLERTIRDRPLGRFLTGTKSERMIEFRLNDSGGPAPSVIDTRYHRATAQYLAAGSFGPLQATLQDWDDVNRRKFLDVELALDKPGEPQKTCLQAVATDLQLAFRVGAVRHAFGSTVVSQPPCSTATSCDQLDWARWWSLILKLYNPDKDEYKTSDRACLKFDEAGKCALRKPQGFNDVIDTGLEKYAHR